MPTHRQHGQPPIFEKAMDIIGAIMNILHFWRFEGMPRDKWSYPPDSKPAVERLIYQAAAEAWRNHDLRGDARFLDYWLEALEYSLRKYPQASRPYMRRELLRRFIGMGLERCRVNFHCFYSEKDWEILLDAWQAQFGLLRDLYLFRKAIREYMEEGRRMPVIADIYSRVPGSAYYREREQEQAGRLDWRQSVRQACGEASGANIIPFEREAAQA